MDDYVTPTLNLVAFGMGFAVAMLWPLYVVLIAATLFSAFKRHWTRWNVTTAALNALPFVVIGLEALAIRQGMDIGPREGFLATALDRFHYFAALAGPIAAVLLGVAALAREIAKRFVHAHS